MTYRISTLLVDYLEFEHNIFLALHTIAQLDLLSNGISTIGWDRSV
jgi:hypothetical protein